MSDQRRQTLEQLVAALQQAGLRGPAEFVVDMLVPLDVVASSVVALGRPLVGGTRIEPFVAALADADGWQELQRLLRVD